MTIPSLTSRQETPTAAAPLNNAGTLKLSTFSMEEHLARQGASDLAPVSDRPVIGASWRERHFAGSPHRSSAVRDAVTPDAAASSDLATAGTLSPDAGQPQPFYIGNPYYDPTDPHSPETIQDPTATATPQPVQWTSQNGLTTTGVMNPFGLTQNNPSIGFYGAQPTTNRT